MKKLVDNVGIKFMLVVSIVICMLFSNLLPIIALAVENDNITNSDTSDTTEDKYVKFNLTWNSDATSVVTETQSALNSTAIAYFKIEFNTIKEEFKNFKIIVKNEKGTTIDLSKNEVGTDKTFKSRSGNTLYLQDITNAGTLVTGNILYNFSKCQEEDFLRNLEVQLTGTYEVNGEEINVNITKKLNASLSETNKFSSLYVFFKETNNTCDYNKDYTLYKTNKVSKEITKKYIINILGGGKYAQAVKIKLTGLKSGQSENNNTPTNIRLVNNDIGYTLGEYNAEEGSIELIRGNENAELDKDNLFDATQEIELYVDYSIDGEDSKVKGDKGVGYYFDLDLNAELEALGYDYYNGAKGEEYTKITIKKSSSCTTKEFIEMPQTGGFCAEEGTFGGDFEKTEISISESQINNIKNGGTEVIKYRSSFNLTDVNKYMASKLYSYHYNFTEADANIPGIGRTASMLKNEKSFVNYGATKYIEPILDCIEIEHVAKGDEGAKIKFYKRGDIEGVNEPFFIATEKTKKYTAPENSNIKEYYAVYDASEVDEAEYWRYHEPSSYWKTGWKYNKEIIGLENEELDKITQIGKYQETVLNRESLPIEKRYFHAFYNHTENWSTVDNFADGVSANVTMKLDIKEDFKERLEGKVRVKSIYISNTNLDGKLSNQYFIYKIGQTPGVDDPIEILYEGNNSFKLEDNIEGFIVVQQVDKSKLNSPDNFQVFYGYEIIDNIDTDIACNCKIEADNKECSYDKENNSITSTTKGEVYNSDATLYRTHSAVNKNYSMMYYVRYNVTNKNYYFNLIGNTEDVSLNSVGEKVKTDINVVIPVRTYDENSYRRVKNPVLYLKLSNNFKYDYENFNAKLQNSKLTIDRTEFIFKNGKMFYAIYTKGEIEENEYRQQDFIKISFSKELKPESNNNNKDIFELYMSDEYENYLNKTSDSYDLDGDGETSDVIFHTNINFNYHDNNALYLKNNVKDSNGNIFSPRAYIAKGKKATMQLITENYYLTPISDVSIIARLPFVGNTSVKYKTTPIGEAEKEITPKFDGNVKLYKNNAEVLKHYYSVGYSADPLADSNSEFTYIETKSSYTAEELETISKAKTIKINFNSELYSKNTLKVEYDITMPEDAVEGKEAGQQFMVKYKYSNNELTIESAPAFAIVGEERKSDITIKKKFEGSNPTVSKKDIQFTIKGLDNNNTYEATTDEDGTAKAENVKPGIYEITEDTTFDNYRNDTKIAFEVTALGGSKEITFDNPLKRGDVIVQKTWLNQNNQVKQVKLEISGTTASGDSYSASKYTNSAGIATFNNVPYGTYEISETEGVDGWYGNNVEVLVNNAQINTIYDNEPGYGDLEIIKTVPEGDNVKGLKFRLYGLGDASYINEQGILIQEEVDRVITIGDDGIGLEKHIPFGTYTLEEIEMPSVTTEDGTETRYIPYKKNDVQIKVHNGKETIDIENKWKTGNLNIIKTATEGTDLSMFKVRVYGNSSYGIEIDKEYDIPLNGKLQIEDLPLGRYKVEEVGTESVNDKIVTTNPDGFEVKYTPADANTTGIKIEYNKTSEAKIHNEFNGTGILKIVKELKDETDVSKAEGIKFKVEGKDGINRDFETEITIGKDGTGTSKPIPVGTYAVTEIEETVPEDYMLCEEQEVKITSKHTAESPYPLSITNIPVTRKNNNGN